jgi:hypothetical protein
MEDAIGRKIQALLELAAHPNTPPPEAENAQAKATALILKHGFDTAALRPKGQANEIAVRSYPLDGKYAVSRRTLLVGIAYAFQCKAIQTHGGGLKLYGTVTNLDAVDAIYPSLVIQMQNEALTSRPPSHVNGAKVVSWRTNFQKAFAGRVYKRLQEQFAFATREAEAEHGSGVGLALADDAKRVAAIFKKENPHTRSSSSRAGSYGYAAGAAAGNRADIGQRKLAGRAALGSGR